MRFAALLLTVLVLSAACGDDGGAPVDAGLPGFMGPDEYCPGQPACTGVGDGVLYVGAAAESITPTIDETWTDENGDSEWQTTEPYVDANGNGKFDAYWIAGFGSGRAANGVNDPIEARAIAFRWNDITYAIVVLDVVGLLGEDLTKIRDAAVLAGLGVDHVQVSSTHVHESVDTVGIWGQNELKSGRRVEYIEFMQAQAIEAVRRAVTDMRPATMTVAQTLILDDPNDPSAGTDEWNHDIRDPVIYDPTLTIARFADAADDTVTIGTLVNWASHPETGGDENLMLSADYPHWLRETTELGLPAEGLTGLGGVTVFVNGALGGQIGPLHGVAPLDDMGMPVPDLGIPKAQAIGTNLGRRALEALAAAGVVATDHAITYRSTELYVAMENIGFQTYFLLDILPPHVYVGYDDSRTLGGDNIPWMPLRVTYFQVGPLATVTTPGELHPELWLGVHTDGSWSWGYPILSADVVDNVPMLSQARQGPFMRDLVLANPGVEYAFVSGCAEDYVGYIVPEYNYVLHPSNPYIEEADGHHYEETRSLEPLEETHLVDPTLELLEWRPPGN